MIHWFGKSWGSALNDDCPQARTPVGWPCTHCDEPIAEGDQGIIYSNGPVAHLDCFIRGTIGSVAHQLKTCSCFFPGATEGDPPGSRSNSGRKRTRSGELLGSVSPARVHDGLVRVVWHPVARFPAIQAGGPRRDVLRVGPLPSRRQHAALTGLPCVWCRTN